MYFTQTSKAACKKWMAPIEASLRLIKSSGDRKVPIEATS